MLIPVILCNLVRLSLLVLLSSSPASASLTKRWIKTSNATPVALSADEQAALVPYANFARASYCSAASVLDWSCGEACTLNGKAKGIAAGGNDRLVPGWFVAYDLDLDAIIVAHQGTTTSSLTSVLEDVILVPGPLDQDMFPGSLAKGVLVHTGFMATQHLTAPTIFDAVVNGTTTYNTTKVVTVGHSLGAAIASLDALYLSIALPHLDISARQFGLPRIGNPAWSSFYSTHVPDSIHITNKDDPVPRLPSAFLGFAQLEGEIWITNDQTESCPGLENRHCAYGRNPLNLDTDNHGGPYFGVTMGADQCTE